MKSFSDVTFERFSHHYFEREGLKQHYLDEGQGAPVVMVHGNPTWCFYYRNLVAALSSEYRCIVPDHIGCGLSDKPVDDQYSYTLERRVDDLEALLEHAGTTGGITLVVHDWGGMIGMAYAARHPERIKRLVVLNTAAFHMPKEKKLPWALWLCRNTPVGAMLVRGFNAFSLAASFVGCKRNPMPSALRRAYRAPYDTWNNRIATIRFVQDIPLQPGDPGYKIVSGVENGLAQFQNRPMLIGWGLLDFVFDRTFLAEWELRFPQAEYLKYEDCGHYVLEDAGVELIPAIVEFLKRTEG